MYVYVDEVGVSSIMGPVLCCAVAVEDTAPIKGVKDSKQISKQKREELYPIIASQVKYAFGASSPAKIERMNIHYAKLEAMKNSVDRLARQGTIDKVIIDGKFTIPGLDYPQEAVVKADSKFWECGAASILAKVRRDNLMTKLSKIEKYSHYKLECNAGYYTDPHRDGIIVYGPTSIHRKNFEYFKYCMTFHNKYKEFVRNGGTKEEFFAYIRSEEETHKQSLHKLWKQGLYDEWKDIVWTDEV